MLKLQAGHFWRTLGDDSSSTLLLNSLEQSRDRGLALLTTPLLSFLILIFGLMLSWS
jgi:hypothetical protein